MLQNFLQNIWKTKSAKNVIEKLNTKEDSSKTTISEVLSKLPNRKKISMQQYNF